MDKPITNDADKESSPARASKDVTKVVERDVWGKDWEFLLACVGFAVGLGNIWRFPYLCYKNGGGAFLVPYFIYLVCGAAPLMTLEVGLGQFMRQGNISIWKICPIFKGVGIGSTMMIFYSNVYYTILLAWALHYLYHSFSSPLPWATCDNEWNSDHCIANSNPNDTATGVDSAVEYWENRVLGRSEGLEKVGSLQWELVWALLVAWLLVYMCVFKGVHSSGKVVYFTATFPYIMLTILLARGITLPGAFNGLLFYVWIDAGTQVFYSFCCTFGGMIALGSYNKYNRDFVRDCRYIATINAFSSIFGGCVIFSVLGYMSHVSGVPISQVAESGPGLAFIVYPKAVALMPLAPLWAVLFFIMLFIVAIDTQFVTVEGFVTALMDQYSQYFRFKFSREIFSLVVCAVCCLFGLTMVTQGGIYVFQIFDYYAASGMVLLCFCFTETIGISWIYGINRWMSDVEDMIGRKPCIWLKICWLFLTPAITMGLLIFSIVKYSPLTYDSTYTYPWYGQALGGILGISSVIFIPLYFLYAIIAAPGVKMGEKFRHATQPNMEETLQIRQAQENKKATSATLREFDNIGGEEEGQALNALA